MDARSADAHAYPTVERTPSSIDWRRQRLLLRRRLPLFLLVWIVGAAASGGAILALPLRYTATAELMIDARRDPMVELHQVLPDLAVDGAAVDTEVEVLKSRALADKVASRLGLDHDKAFDGARRFSFFKSSATTPAHLHEATVDRLWRRLHVERLGNTSVIAVSFPSTSPDQAAAIANMFADLYLQRQLDAKSAAAHRASDLLSSRLGALRTEVEAAEAAVERYKAAHGLMTLSDQQGATITEQEISSLDTQMASARSERAEAQARLASAEAQVSGGKGGDLGEVLNSPVVQELRKQRTEAAKQVADLQGRYGPRHPELLKAQRQMVELDGQIQQEIGRVVANLKVQAGVAQSRSAAVTAALASAKAELAGNNAASVQLKELQRNLDSVRTLYQSFLDRLKQTSAQDGMAQPDARRVSAARPPLSPSGPNRLLLGAGALVGWAVIALLAISIAEAREDGLYASQDVGTRLGLACLGFVPRVKGAPTDAVINEPLSVFTEAFRGLKASFRAAGRFRPIRKLMVTSAAPGEGKTTACLCLGRVMATTTAPVVVVDCDLRRRAMSRLLPAPPRVGLLEVLSGAVVLEEALVADSVTGLYLLPLGDETLATDDLLDSPAMDRLLETLQRRFALAILDTAPVLMVAETRLLADKVDAVLFISRWAKTPADMAVTAVRILEAAGARVVGAVLMQADLSLVGSRDYPYAADDYPFYRPDPRIGVRGAVSDGVQPRLI